MEFECGQWCCLLKDRLVVFGEFLDTKMVKNLEFNLNLI